MTPRSPTVAARAVRRSPRPSGGRAPSSTASTCWARCHRAGPATSWPARCSTASAPSTSSPSRPRPTPSAARVVHKVLEDLFDLPAAERTPEPAARAAGARLGAAARGRARAGRDVRATGGAASSRALAGLVPRSLDRYFTLEDPRRLEPAERELYVETLLDSKLLLRGFVDRLDVAPTGEIRVVDYKTGQLARRGVRGQGAVPDEVLRPGALAHAGRGAADAAADLPRQRRGAPLRPRRGRPAGHRAQGRGDLGAIRARRGDRRLAAEPAALCGWCAHQAICPAFGGTPPPLPERKLPTPAEDPAGDLTA